MKNEENVELMWNDKKTISVIEKYNYSVIEKYGDGDYYNLLFFDDNIKVLQTIYNDYDGKIKLIYIDPPYNSRENYYYRIKHLVYKDRLFLNEYLQSLYERIDLMKGLLRDNGFIVVHLDWHSSHYVKVIMDELFGLNNFRNEIIVKNNKKNFQIMDEVKKLYNTYQVMLVYSKNPDTKFKQLKIKKQNGGYWHKLIISRNALPRKYQVYEIEGVKLQGNERWAWGKERLLRALKNYEYYKDVPDNELPDGIDLAKFCITKTGRKIVCYYVRKKDYEYIDNNWMDIANMGLTTPYPTEKNGKILHRIVEMFTNEDDIVADFYCGSGTTLITAEKLNRRWIGCDNSEIAINVTKERLLKKEGCKPFKILKGV